MKITISNTESVFNRATRKHETREVMSGSVQLPSAVSLQLRKLAREYRISPAEMVGLALQFYFGDGKNHLQCEHCDYWREGCKMPEPGEQTTIPVLDKGMVVVGLSTDDLR